MPAYCYRCECGQNFDRVLPVTSCRKKVRCPNCNSLAKRDFVKEHNGVAHHPGNWPMLSTAAGVLPSQVKKATAEAARLGVPTAFAKDGRVIFTGPNHRKEFCERVSHQYDRNSGYGGPRRNARRD